MDAGLSGALDALGGSAFVEALAERQELLRFGDSRITYQHSDERLLVRIKLVRGGRAAWATTGSLDPVALKAIRLQLEDALCQLPATAEADLPASDGEVRPSTTSFLSTETQTAAARAELLREILSEIPHGSKVGGSVATTVVHHRLAASTGLHRDEQRTRAMVQLVASRGPQSAYARTLHRDAAALDLQHLVPRVTQSLQRLPPRSLDPGVYRAVLQAPAVIVLLATLGQCAFNGRAFLDGESVFSARLGERVLSPTLTLSDDGADARGLPTGFDCQGTPKVRVPLVDQGVLVGAVQTTTGHQVPPAWRFGSDPIPSHLVLEPGAFSEDDLVRACGTGLMIQRVDYVRIVHARETLVTGTTRDATWWIDNGRAVARLPQFRFTLRLVDLFNAVEAVASRLERGEAVFMESVVAPAMLVSAFPVASVVA